MRRYVLAVVVEAEDADAAMEFARNELVGGEPGPVYADGTGVVYLGDACSTIPADEYETDLIALVADGELAIAAPPDAVERRKAEFEAEVDRLEGEGRR